MQIVPDDLWALLDGLIYGTDGDTVTLGDLLAVFDNRSYGLFLLIPAIITVAPNGAIPGMSIVTGLIIILVVFQMVIGREQIWLPESAVSFSFNRKSLKATFDKAGP